MEFQDRILRCVDCGKEFVWTAGEQQFFADKNFKNEPKRCKACKAKTGQPTGGGHGGARASGNGHQLLELRQGNHGAVQTHPGATGLLQGVLPVPQIRRGWRPVTPAVSSSLNHGTCSRGQTRLRTARAVHGGRPEVRTTTVRRNGVC